MQQQKEIQTQIPNSVWLTCCELLCKHSYSSTAVIEFFAFSWKLKLIVCSVNFLSGLSFRLIEDAGIYTW